ncbi:MAG: methyltransferase domain-containing protein [Candidatus Helarchaeota archaeon]
MGRPKKKLNYQQIQEIEAKTWLLNDPIAFRDKKQREIIRYPLMVKQMGLNYLDTSDMIIFDVGAGPFGGVSTVLPAKQIIRIDPLKKEYKKIANTDSYSDVQAEVVDYSPADLVISTNAIDHFENPKAFFNTLINTMKPGAYFAHLHAIDNAITHPHPAHVHNINPELVRSILRADYEEIWYLDYLNDKLVYGWRKQPAFSGLYRKVTGYGK